MPSLSVVIITYNEARNIARCLDSVAALADEVLVLDSFSTDDTAAICGRYPALRFEQHVFDGHIQQKNRALALAQYDWVLALDADEALDPALREAIFQVKNTEKPACAGYAMNRLTNYCGQWIRHSGWYPDRKLRLFDRRQGAWGGTNPHDRVLLRPNAREGRLSGDLLHYSYYTVAEHWERAQRYADIAAKALFAQGRRSSWWRMWLSPAFKFFRNYVLKAGFLDGRAGLTICRIAALETRWKYVRLADLWKKIPPPVH